MGLFHIGVFFMKKFTKLLSIAMLASALAVAPSFAVGDEEATKTEQVKLDDPDVIEVAQVVAECKAFEKLANGLKWTDLSTYNVTQNIQNNHPHKTYIAKWIVFAALVGTNTHVQSVAAYLYAQAQSLLGIAEEEIQAEEEPTRVVIGRQA